MKQGLIYNRGQVLAISDRKIQSVCDILVETHALNKI